MVFDKFADYLYSLTPGAWQKIAKAKNNFYALFTVIGALLDDSKNQLFWAREQGMILTCSPELLEIHGQERNMSRLKGEDIEAYRLRLAMKADIARQAGTNEGIKTAVKALGYDNSYVEPYYDIDPTRWAEFIVWLKTTQKAQVSLNDFAVIDAEVMKVKPASALPNYGVEFGSNLVIEASITFGSIQQPKCGTFKCGTYPPEGSALT